MGRLNLEAIRRRAAAATPGTWRIGSRFGSGVLGSSVAVISGKLPPIELDPRRNGRADAAFIAHARQDIPALLVEVDRLSGEVERLRAAAGLVRWVDRPMVEGLRDAAARGDQFAVTLCRPGTRDLLALIDALLAVTPQHRCLAVREWQPPESMPESDGITHNLT